MKKMRKSLKIFIALVSVALVAIATVVTVVIVNHNKRKGSNPAGSDYVLTAEQKLLVGEINNTTNTLVSDSKLYAVKYDTEVIELKNYTYFDKHTLWTEDHGSYFVEVYDEAGEVAMFQSVLSGTEGISPFTSANVIIANKNHFVVHVVYATGDNEVIVCSAQDGEILVHKKYAVVETTDYWTHNGSKFQIYSSNNFFAVLLNSAGTYYYELNEFLTDYSGYNAYKYTESGIENASISIIESSLYVDSTEVVSFSQGAGFMAVTNSDLIENWVLKNGKIVVTKTIHDSKTDGAHLVSGKYYSYSYSLTSNNKTAQIDLYGYNKISGIMYSGEKYFGVFMQKVNSANELVDGGLAVYFDYDLNIIAKYEASSHESKIFYAEGAKVLTKDGLLTTKNNVILEKSSSFSTLELSFYKMLAGGKFILKDNYDSLFIYNFNLEQVCDTSFDLITTAIDDNNYIFQKQGEYYLYNLTKNSASKIKYVNNSLLKSTTMYLIQNDENDETYSLYEVSSSTPLENNVLNVIEDGENSLTIETADGKVINYYLVENVDDMPVLVSTVSMNGAVKADTIYTSDGSTDDYLYYTGHNGTTAGSTYIEPDWYDYEDKVLRNVQNLSNVEKESYMITAMHCIDKGYYSKIVFRDYFEFAYNGQNSSNSTSYSPLRCYYSVSIVNGEPQLEVTGIAHYFLKSGSNSSVAENHRITDSYFLMNGHLENNQRPNYSYDFSVTSGFSTSYFYAYASDPNSDGSGFQYIKDGSYAEVYGDSIRVVLKFEFKQYLSYYVNFANCKFGQSSIDDSEVKWVTDGVTQPTTITEQAYYNNLYYQTIVVGYKQPSGSTTLLNSDVNYYSSIIDQADSSGSGTNTTPVTSYFSNTQLGNLFKSGNESNPFVQCVIQDTEASSTQFTATVSNKMYYSDNYSTLYVGKIALDIAGGRLIGFTDFDNTAYNAVSNSDLYDKTSRTYREEELVYRAYGYDSSTNTSAFDILDYEYLTYNKDLYDGNGTYILRLKNANEIYHAEGGLNKFRYVYCIYEPMTYYMTLDYNVGANDDTENAGIANEIDYLKNYAGLSIGVESRTDYTEYNELWAYNVEQADFSEYTSNADSEYYSKYNGIDKYSTKDFTDNDTRLGDNSDGVVEKSATRINGYNGNYSVITRSVIVYGIYYYFSVWTGSSSSGGYYDLTRDGENKIYLVAKKSWSSLTNNGTETVRNHYDLSSKTDYLSSAGEYVYGADEVIVCVDFTDNTSGDVYYREKNVTGGASAEIYSPISEYKSNGSTYYYTNIAGERYYIQKKFSTYTKPYTDAYESGGLKVLFLKAYKKIADFESTDTTEYGKFVSSNASDYKAYSFTPGKDVVEICIKFEMSDVRAYYFATNNHTRTGSYDGHYYYSGGSVIEDTSEKTYSVSEKFAFLYTDDIKFTSNPVHTHFEFAGWKVRIGDVATYVNSDNVTGIFVPDYSSNSTIQQINPVDGKYLAGSSSTYSSLWSALLTTVDSNGNITWKSASDIFDSPITLIAQWEPKDCTIEVTLWTQNTTEESHKGVVRNTESSDPNDNNYLIFDEITDEDTVPEFTVGNTSIDSDKNGILDLYITFKYSSTKTYDSIYEDVTAQYNVASINATGMEWKIAGWVYQNTEGAYKSISGSNVKIAEYIGDTTKLALNAFYSEANYNISISLNPMGGALNAENKGYTGSYETIYNDENSFARYNVHISNTIGPEATTGFNEYYLNDESSNEDTDMSGVCTGYNKLALEGEQTKYQFTLADGKFLVGNDISITIEEATERYYVKRLIFKEVTLYNNDGNMDKYTIVFEYDTGSSSWTITATSQTNTTSTLSVQSTNDGGVIKLTFGSQAEGKKYNNEKNVFSIQNTPKGVVVNVEKLSNPGAIDYTSNKVSGDQGFVMECVLESYSIKNESVNIITKVNDEMPSDEVGTTLSFDFNKSIMTSAQPITNVEGKDPVVGELSFIWLGSQRYLFVKKWQSIDSYVSGYYKMYTGDQQEAELKEDYTYEEFISQPIVKDTNLMVYYNNETGMIYYPTQTNLDIVENETTLMYNYGYYGNAWLAVYYIRLNGNFYYICRQTQYSTVEDNILLEGSAESPKKFKDCYVQVYLTISDYNTIVMREESDYNATSNYYEDGATSFIIHLKDDGSGTGKGIVEYKTNNGKTTLYANYNNTRVIAIDPEQEHITLSANPSSAITDALRYELKYYISKLTIADKVFEFDKPTRELSFADDYYTYNSLILNYKSGVTGTPEFATDDFISYMGVNYYIQDSYMWDFGNDDSNRMGAEKYYFYLTRDENGFTRYFLIFDVDEDDQVINSGNFVNIEIEFARFLNNLQINVTEEDLYHQATESLDGGWEYSMVQKSFSVSYAENTSSKTTYSWNDNYLTGRQTFEYMKARTTADLEKMQDRVFYESVGYQDDGVTANEFVSNKIALLSNLGDVPTLKWSAITKFYPCDTNRLTFKAKSGYIIKSISITFGVGDTPDIASGVDADSYKKIISFELDESSFDDLNYLSLTGQYSYLNPNNSTPLLKYKISGTEGYGLHGNTQSIGYNILPGISGSTGIMYGVMENDSWQTKSEDTYTIDEIFVLLSGLYGNVTIDMTTTSYSEYLFESGGEDVNPLIRDENDVVSDGSGKAYKYLEAAIDTTLGFVTESVLTQKTYLDVYTQKPVSTSPTEWEYDLLSNGVEVGEDPENPIQPSANYTKPEPEGFATGNMIGGTATSVQNYIGDKYLVQYYFENSTGGIKQGTIRVIFCGTVSRIKGGLHFMATHNDYSVYFSNGKYYNQATSDIINTSSMPKDAFCNLDDYSGRTSEDKIIEKDIQTKEVDGEGEIKTSRVVELVGYVNGIPNSKCLESRYIVIDDVKYYFVKDYNVDDNSRGYLNSDDETYKYFYYKVVKESAISGVLYPNEDEDEMTDDEAIYKKAYYQKGCDSFYICVNKGTTSTEYKYHVIDSETSGPLNYTNKLVYMSTGAIATRTDPLSVDSQSTEVIWDGYFDSKKANFATGSKGNESNFKYFLSVTAVKNTVTLDTSAYLYDKTVSAGTYSANSHTSFNNSDLTYNFIDENKLAFKGQEVYQLDNTSKEDSWFNDTILTNLQFNSYMDEYDATGTMTSNPKTWVNRSTSNSNISELSTYEMDGFDFSWTYYTIAGYKLKYIMVYLVDLQAYYVIDVYNIFTAYLKTEVDNNGNTLGEFISIGNNPTDANGKNYDYNFKLEFYKDINPLKNNSGEDISGGTEESEGSCYKFYPIVYEDDNLLSKPNSVFDKKNEVINKLKSVNIMSNNIKVAFISEPIEYKIQYNTHKDENDNEMTVNARLDNPIAGVSSTPSYSGVSPTSFYVRQTIKYDCMTQLNCTMTLNGYTFIGWGSEKYFNGTEYVSRYKAKSADGSTPVTWNSSSSWYDPTQFFVMSQDSSGAYVSGYQSAVNFYNYYSNRNASVSPGDPCKAFYVSGAYFVTDTGYKSGYEAQNYNFYGDYAEIFSANVDSKQVSTFALSSLIHLFALFKANVYTIQFEVNNEKGDAYYLSLEEIVLGTSTASDWLTTSFTSDKFGIQTIDASNNTRTYYAYVTFDTNNWYYSENNGQSLLYAYRYCNDSDPTDDPYIISDITKEDGSGNKLSRLSVDMFGYSWLGWYYKQHTLENEGSGSSDQLVLQSSYNKTGGYTLPILNDTFYGTLNSAGALTDVNSGTFVYNGQHKTNTKIEFKLVEGNNIENYEFSVYDSSQGKYRFKYLDTRYYFKVDTSSSTKGKYYQVFSSPAMDSDDYVSGMYVSIYDEDESNNPKVMYLMSSKLSALDGYVYFYDYSSSAVGINSSFDYGTNEGWCGIPNFKFTMVADSLNTCYWQTNAFIYAKKFATNMVFSYFDTSLSSSAYSVTGSDGAYYLRVDRSDVSKTRYIKLFANWVNNKYLTVFEFLDSDSGFEKIGSSVAGGISSYNNGYAVYYNCENLDDYLWDESKLPYRVGYDFVGWTFNYIYSGGDYANGTIASLYDAIYQPSSELNLNYKLYSQYAVLNGVTGKSPYESNIFMINGSRVSTSPAEDWLLNASDTAEHLGDIEGKDANRYIYIFPVWRAQTFSFGVSLNVNTEKLDNLYEKDSNFALGLYNSSVHSDYSVKTTAYTGISSKFYTYNTTAETAAYSNGYSSYPNYFNDIVANIYFEIEFDNPIDTARLSFAGRTYTLKDLFMTSAGYYFLGLMYQQVDNGSGDAQYFIKNTLKSILELDSTDNVTYIRHEDTTGTIAYNSDSVFNSDMYDKIYRSRYDGDSVESAQVKVTDNLLDYYNISGTSTNFGYLKTGGKTYYIKSEQVGLEYYLYVLINNKKYYVVFYELDSDGVTERDTITFDKTFMYYLDRDANGNLLNTYIIRFDSDGNPYYVKDSFKTRIKPTIKMAVYHGARNTYDFSKKEQTVNVTSSTIYTTREFTLYAHWEKKTNITSTIVNGNNNNGQDDNSQSANSNLGLAGYYTIDDGADGTIQKQSTGASDNLSSNLVAYSHDFYSDVAYEFLPYFNGRYISELAIEFDSLIDTGSGITSRYELVHNTLTLRFTFTSSDISSEHKITITEVIWNGVNFASSMTSGSGANYVYYGFKDISELSLLDKFSLNLSYNSAGVSLYDYNKGTLHDRTNINPVTLKLNNLMTSVKFTCKYSVQTFQVEVYNVVVDAEELSKLGDGTVQTPFLTLEAMENASNKATSNRGAYGAPYISNLNYSTTTASTISSNTAMQARSYNVPYYYFMGTVTDTSSITYAGLDYIYGSNYTYLSGTTGLKVVQQNNTLGTLLTNMTTRGYKAYSDQTGTSIDEVWYTFKTISGGNRVILDGFNNGDGHPIIANTTIYGLFIQAQAERQVKFYYWDNDLGSYVQYTNNEREYNSNMSIAQGGKIETDYTITELPSPSIAPWYGDASANELNKKFIGYVCIDGIVLEEINMQTIFNEYGTQLFNQKTCYTQTSGDLYSYLYKKYGAALSFNTIENITELFKYRIKVVDNSKYYTVEKGGKQVLDSVRAEITVDINIDVNNDGVKETHTVTFEKDLKVLNVDYGLRYKNTGVTYAIPLYEDIEFEFTGYNFSKSTNTLSLSTLSNIVRSNVFEVGSQYTVFHNPQDARIAVTNTSNISLSGLDGLPLLNDTSGTTIDIANPQYLNFEEVTRQYSSNTYTFGMKKLKTSSGTYFIYLYYVDAAGKAFYKTSNYITLVKNNASSTGLTNTHIEAISPIELELNNTYSGYYEKAEAEIDSAIEAIRNGKYTGLYSEAEANNRKLVVYILMQLLQSGYVDIYNNNMNYYYGASSSYSGDGTQTEAEESNIVTIIDAINNLIRFTANGVEPAEAIGMRVTNIFGLYRMAYSMAYQFVSTTGYNGGNTIGLRALYAKGEASNNSLGATALSYECIDTAMGETFMDAYAYNLRPGDFLKDDKTLAGAVAVRDVASSTNTYSYTTQTISEVNTQIAMYLYASRDGSDGTIVNITLLMPNMTINNQEQTITYKNKDDEEVSTDSSNIAMLVVSRKHSLDRIYQDYEKYERYEFKYNLSGLYEADPLRQNPYFNGISSPTTGYTDPAGSSSSKQIDFYYIYWINDPWTLNDTITYVKTGYTGDYYYLKDSYEKAVTNAKKSVAIVDQEAKDYATNEAIAWAESYAEAWVEENYPDLTGDERTAKYEYALTKALDSQGYQNAWLEAYNAKLAELKSFSECLAEELSGLTKYTYDASNYNATSNKGYVLFAGYKFYYYDLSQVKYFYRIKDPSVTDEASLDSRYYVVDRSGYDTDAYWLRIGTGTSATSINTTNTSKSSSYIYTRYESYFTDDWNKSASSS